MNLLTTDEDGAWREWLAKRDKVRLQFCPNGEPMIFSSMSRRA